MNRNVMVDSQTWPDQLVLVFKIHVLSNITCPGVERGLNLSPPVAMMLWGKRKILMKLTPDSEVWTIARNTRVFNLPITDNTTDVRILDSLGRRPLWGSVSAFQRSFHTLELKNHIIFCRWYDENPTFLKGPPSKRRREEGSGMQRNIRICFSTMEWILSSLDNIQSSLDWKHSSLDSIHSRVVT